MSHEVRRICDFIFCCPFSFLQHTGSQILSNWPVILCNALQRLLFSFLLFFVHNGSSSALACQANSLLLFFACSLRLLTLYYMYRPCTFSSFLVHVAAVGSECVFSFSAPCVDKASCMRLLSAKSLPTSTTFPIYEHL